MSGYPEGRMPLGRLGRRLEDTSAGYFEHCKKNSGSVTVE
jgi:hypothetical protein